MNRIVGIGEMIISNNTEDTIKTFALASCVGVTAYSPVRKVGGLIHIALPKPATQSEGSERCYYYASTGIPLFINKIYQEYGCSKGELRIHIYGGADSIRENDAFRIGRKNIEITKRILKKMNLNVDFMEIGEKVSRTIELDMVTGQVNIWRQNIII